MSCKIAPSRVVLSDNALEPLSRHCETPRQSLNFPWVYPNLDSQTTIILDLEPTWLWEMCADTYTFVRRGVDLRRTNILCSNASIPEVP